MSHPSTTAKVPRGIAAGEASRLPQVSELPSATELHDGWERFWFTPEPAESLRFVRIGLGVLAALYFASHWADIGYWFGSEGVLSTEQLSRLNQSTEAAGAARWHLTPLYWIESALGLRVVLGLGILASLLTAAGVGGRITGGRVNGEWLIVTLAWLILLSVVARCWMIAGLVEIPLVFGLSGLMIAAAGRGEARGGPADGTASSRRWTAGFARRLLEIHVAALVAATALTQLASESWWNGEGALQLVLPIDGPAFELASLGNSPLATAALTHLIVWLPIAVVPLLWFPVAPREQLGREQLGRQNAGAGNGRSRLQRAAAGLLIVHALGLGVLSGHLLYGAANAVLLSLFLVPRRPSGAENREQG